MKKIITKEFTNNMLITAGLLFLSTILSFILFIYISHNPVNIALFYFIGILSIARYTNGYFYGIFSSFCSILLIYWFYTYPYFNINTTSMDYPFTFSCMLALSLITSASTTYIKRQSQLLTLHQKQLAEAENERARANLLRAVSHDLRTPLTSILGSVSCMEEDNSFMSIEQIKIMHNIRDDARWLLHMVENLLSVTRIENTNSKLNTVPEIVDEVVAESVTRLTARIPDANIDVSVPSNIIMIPMDAMLIEQVLINLLENAVVHSHSQKPIQLTIEEHADHVSFRITDYGIGLNESRLEHIFDGTYTHNSSADAQRGIGIGLSICHTIIVAHQGTISAHNHAKGAEFVFSLPKEAIK